MADDVQKAVDAKNEKTNEFLAKKNVVGVGVGYKNKLGEDTGDASVVVLVQKKKPAAALTEEDMIPSEVDGTKTDVVEIGFLRAQGINPRAEFRPVMQPGISMAHYMVGAGTFGAVVRHRETGERFILSNNHVLANSNDATIGDSILQPGSLDGGTIPGDVIGQLEAFRRLAYIEDAPDDDPVIPPDDPGTGGDDPDEGGSGGPDVPDPAPPDDEPEKEVSFGNAFIDFLVALANLLARWVGSDKRAAVASAAALAAARTGQISQAEAATVVKAASASRTASGMSPAEVPFKAQTTLDNLLDAALARPNNPSALSDEILQIGRVTGTKPAELGMTVAKFGRTTGYEEGRVTLLDATVNVQYETLAGTKTARFVSQVITTGMSKSGDSGSLVVDPSDNQAVGLLFAGSEVATIFTPIDRVLSYFNVEF